MVDEDDKVIGIISLSDLLMYLVLRPTGDCANARLRADSLHSSSIEERDENPLPDDDRSEAERLEAESPEVDGLSLEEDELGKELDSSNSED